MNDNLSRRSVLRLAASTTALGALGAACGTGNRPARRLHLLIDTSPAGKALQTAIAKYNAGRPPVKATFDSVPFASLQQKTLLNFVSGTNQYDVVQAGSNGITAIANHLYPLDQRLQRDRLSLETLFGTAQGVQWKGKSIGLPYRNATNVLAYRKDLLKDAGITVPATIQEFVDAAISLHKTRKVRFGSGVVSNEPTFSRVTISYLYLPYGVHLINADGTGPDESLRGDTAVNLLEELQRLVRSGATPNPVSWSYSDEITAWQQGWVGLSNVFAAWTDSFKDTAGRIGYALGPGQPATARKLSGLGPYRPSYAAGAWYLAINAKAASLEDAWRFTRFATTTPASQEAMAFEADNQPTLLSVLDSARYGKAHAAAKVQLEVFQKVGWAEAVTVQKGVKVDEAVHSAVQGLYQGRNAGDVARAMFEGVAKAVKDA
ncbi:ABC transporter substrate-binding protein [Actinoallomurus iriomotensis]|uniref:Uncharacterized protein n=1 Tax=Actinoallomurus iriomotensis TaxID=478107 RepID=A0A9W6W7M8_9ACTN|nr:extracellular solute-binding protein [Actinoallomurus iriomotensis]GLY92301.1 hypothetical protein Airi02_102290 [Actinoallomurus iriomotensis]